MALFQTEKPKRSGKISELVEARLYLFEEMRNNFLLYFIVLSVVGLLLASSVIVHKVFSTWSVLLDSWW